MPASLPTPLSTPDDGIVEDTGDHCKTWVEGNAYIGRAKRAAGGRFKTVPDAGEADDGSALIAAQRHIDAARRDERCASAGGAACRIAAPMRVVHGTQEVRMAAAGEAEILAGSLADDLPIK
jgi:hypothetical protein